MNAPRHPFKLLLSAYACEPDKGSEPGVGWRWALEIARLGHEVVVLTRENNRPALEQAMLGQPELPNLRFAYCDLPRWARWWKKGVRGIHLYYLLWQAAAFFAARQLHRVERFDAVHHITFAVARQPSFMGHLGIPFVVGPVGGAERAPLALRRHFSAAGYGRDVLRDIANLLSRFDPAVRRMYAAASVILVKTPETLAWLPEPYRARAYRLPEIGADRVAVTLDPPAAGRADGEFHLLYAGRFVDFKGLGLGLRALALLRQQGRRVDLTLVGDGPLEHRWRALARTLGIAEALRWVPRVTQAEVFAMYSRFDAFLFPSLHDSGGTVVLEAMARGLPVVCLALGGPAELVDGSCGRVVAVEGCDESEVVAALAAAVGALCDRREETFRLRQGALARAREFDWTRLVDRVWGADGLGCRAVADYALQKGRLHYEKSQP